MTPPRTWLLLGRKAGDNTQIRALAGALDWPCEEKHIRARNWELFPHLLFGGSLLGIKRGESSELSPPWPELLITAGRRSEPVARWVKKQSGGSTRLVHIGRPWAPLDSYDLIITTPQYFLPEQANVLCNRLPLNSLISSELPLLSPDLQRQLAGLPRPYITVLVGGDSGKFVFTAEKGKRLGKQLRHLSEEAGGSLLLSNSARTPKAAWAALCDQLSGPRLVYDHAASARENPYREFLGLADQFVVTGESMSMLGEAVALGKPVQIFNMDDTDTHWWKRVSNYGYKPLSHRLAGRLAPQRMRRDVGKIQQNLIDTGAASWLGQELVLPATDLLAGKAELDTSAQRVRKLFSAC